MSTVFNGSGNIGLDPVVRSVPNGNAMRYVLNLNVYFDNPVSKGQGEFEDKGGFWAPVAYWTDHAEHLAKIFQKGMRVVVTGRIRRETWTDQNGQEQVTFRVDARQVAILPNRILSIQMEKKEGRGETSVPVSTPAPVPPQDNGFTDFDDDIPF